MENVYIIALFEPRHIRTLHYKAYSSIDKAEQFLKENGYIKPEKDVSDAWVSKKEQFVYAKILEFEFE